MKKNRYVIKAAAAACTIFVLTAGSCWNKKPASTTIKLKAEDDSALAALAMAAGSNNDNQGTAEWDGDGTSPDENKQLINAVCEAIEYGDEDKLKELVDKAPHLFYENVNIDGIETTPIHLIYGKPMSTIAEELLLNKGAGKQSVEQTKNLLNGNKKSPFDVLPLIGNLLKAGESTIDILMLQVVKNGLTGDEKIFRVGNGECPDKSLIDLFEEAITEAENKNKGAKNAKGRKSLTNRLAAVGGSNELKALLQAIEKCTKKAKNITQQKTGSQKNIVSKPQTNITQQKTGSQKTKVSNSTPNTTNITQQKTGGQKTNAVKPQTNSTQKITGSQKNIVSKPQTNITQQKTGSQKNIVSNPQPNSTLKMIDSQETKAAMSTLSNALDEEYFTGVGLDELKTILKKENGKEARRKVRELLRHEISQVTNKEKNEIQNLFGNDELRAARDAAKEYQKNVSFFTWRGGDKRNRFSRIVTYLNFLMHGVSVSMSL